MRKTIKRTIVTTVMFAMLINGFAGCGGCNTQTLPNATSPTVTTKPLPTKEITPTEIPELEPTETPVLTDTPEPSVTAEPTITVAPTATPEPTSTPVPTDTPTPEPTSTPTPVVKVDEGAKLLATVKMGDNVYYDYYDDKTLVVRGKGKTKDLKDVYRVQLAFEDEVSGLDTYYITTVIIEEGITELGACALPCLYSVQKVIFPSSLKKIGDEALRSVGYFAEKTEYIGLDLTKVEVAKTAFSYCGSPENLEGLKEYTATPTPTPTPSPTPTPNPAKPRVYATKKMGDNITYEFWDNGCLYIKGTGATYDKSWDFVEFRKEPYCNTHSVIVEEGITYIGENALNELRNIVYYSYPESLEDAYYTGAVTKNKTITFDGFYQGKKIRIKTSKPANPDLFFAVIKDIDKAIADGCEVTFP